MDPAVGAVVGMQAGQLPDVRVRASR